MVNKFGCVCSVCVHVCYSTVYQSRYKLEHVLQYMRTLFYTIDIVLYAFNMLVFIIVWVSANVCTNGT